mgnify:CR=1 FL=1
MERKKFDNIEDAVQWLENQMIIATVKQLHQEQLDYIDQAVLKSDLSEANTVIKHIMEK